jgi:hypothetical protein
MCDPVTLGSITAVQMATAQLAIGAASAVVGYVGQQQAANAQEAANKEATKNAVFAANQNYEATQRRMYQEAAAASVEKTNANIASAEARATASTAAGEAGVQGYSIDSIIGSYYAKQGRYNEAIDTNFQMSRQALADGMDQTHNATVSTINSLPVPQKPSFLDAAIRVAGSGLSASKDYYGMTNG